MWGERGLISHKFEGTGEGGAGVCTEGLPRGCARVHDAAGWLHSGWELGVQLAVARWARLAAGRVHYGRAAGGCPMGQAGRCTMGVQLAVARWARLAAGRVHNGRSAGGCPMGQAVSWAGAQWACSWRLPDGPGCQLGGCTMGVQLAVARWARLSTGHAMAIPARCRGCQTRMICRRDLFLTQKNYDDGKWYCSNYIYSNI